MAGHERDIVRGGVVTEVRLLQLVVLAEVTPQPAQVTPGGKRGVVQVVGIANAIIVAVTTADRPGLGYELHGPDRSVPLNVAIEGPAVRVSDCSDPGPAIEGNADDGTVRATIGMERTPTERAVAALNSSNPGDHPPRQAAGGIGLGEGDLGSKVGIEGNDRDVESGDYGGPSGSTNGIFRRGKRLYRSRAVVARGSQRFTQRCDIGSEGKESALKISDRGAEPGALVFEHAK